MVPYATNALAFRCVSLLLAASLAFAMAPPCASKDIGPRSAACDGMERKSQGWIACLGTASRDLDDAQLFYAGYWLARGGAYQEALTYLRLARKPDERILTYTGFATRKLGDAAGALDYYRQALDINPDYTVAHAYLGEAYLALGDPSKARDQLAEVEKRCGSACVEYAELAAEITRYESRGGSQG